MVALGHPCQCQEYRPSLELRIPYLPNSVSIDGQPTLYFEIHLTNFSSDSIFLDTLQIVSAHTNQMHWVASGKKLHNSSANPGMTHKSDRVTLWPGGSGVVYIELSTKTNSQAFTCQLHFTQATKQGVVRQTVTTEIVSFETQKALPVLGAPLKSGTWVAIYDPSWERGHRRVIYTINGKACIPGRYAIDFMRVDEQGRYASQDENPIKNWYGYANEVLAVADGKVVGLRNDFPESPTLATHPAYSADKATGNYIALDIGDGYVVFYEHLKPGSLKVKLGQQVKRGETIAALGFTGQTTGPHLHLHVASANSPLGAEGVAFTFNQFKKIGYYESLDNFGKQPWIPAKDHSRPIIYNERPGSNHVIQF